MSVKRDFYSILGVSQSASADEIKKAYRKLAVNFHPDKNPGSKTAENRFKEISVAYDTLKDPVKRSEYDMTFFRVQHSNTTNRSQSQPNQSTNSEFGDIFSEFFYANKKKSEEARARGADLKYTLSITLEEMASGCLKTIQYMKKKAGKSIATKLEVKVPPGVKDGQRLKLKGEGDSSAPPFSFTGDLYVVVKQRPHLIFTRVDNNVLLDLPVSFVDALLGKSLNVLTLSGKVKIQLPPGTPSGKTLRLKGKGFPDINGNESGDMLVTIQIDIPEKLTKKEQEIIEKLSYLNQECPLLSDYTKKVEQLEKDRL